MSKKEFTQLATNIIGVIALVLVAFGVLRPDAAPETAVVTPESDIVQLGATNFDDLELSGNLDVTGNTTVTGTLTYGSNDLNPLGYGSSGQQLVYGTASMTGTFTVTHGLTTVTFAVCTLGEDPGAGAGDAAMCTVTVSGNVVVVKNWQDDFVTAATETTTPTHWLVVGAP